MHGMCLYLNCIHDCIFYSGSKMSLINLYHRYTSLKHRLLGSILPKKILFGMFNIQALISRGTEIDARDQEGKTPLMWFAGGFQYWQVKVKVGGNVNCNIERIVWFTWAQ